MYYTVDQALADNIGKDVKEYPDLTSNMALLTPCVLSGLISLSAMGCFQQLGKLRKSAPALPGLTVALTSPQSHGLQCRDPTKCPIS